MALSAADCFEKLGGLPTPTPEEIEEILNSKNPADTYHKQVAGLDGDEKTAVY